MLAPSLRCFGQTEGQKERKLRGQVNYHHKDFTKNSNFKDYMSERVNMFKSRTPYVPLSKLAKLEKHQVSKKRRPYMSMSHSLNPQLLKRANRAASKQVGATVDDIWEKEGGGLRDKFFVLDHTAEVLENYRRIKENEIFEKVLFEEREKKAFLRKESRKTENLIDNFEHKFLNYKYA